MIGVILILYNREAQMDYESLLRTINETNNIHFCIVGNRSSEDKADSLSQLERVTDKVSVIDIKKYVKKATILKVAFRYLRGYINLDHIGYFEFKEQDDSILFNRIMKTFENDNEVIVKIKLLRNINNLKRMINKRIFSIMDLFNAFYTSRHEML